VAAGAENFRSFFAKHWLWASGLIQSPECRLPLTRVSAGLAAELEALAREPAAVGR
jgi:4-hydroxy-tetrahydrodipicolinate synthase